MDTTLESLQKQFENGYVLDTELKGNKVTCGEPITIGEITALENIAFQGNSIPTGVIGNESVIKVEAAVAVCDTFTTFSPEKKTLISAIRLIINQNEPTRIEKLSEVRVDSAMLQIAHPDFQKEMQHIFETHQFDSKILNSYKEHRLIIRIR